MKKLIGSMIRMFKGTRREDPIFGSMLYMGDSLKYWEAKTRFPPTGSEIEIFVDGLADEDMEQQHEFFKRLSEEWPAGLREHLETSLQQRFHEMNPKRKDSPDRNQFVVSSISIPKGSIDSAEWEISFSNAIDNYLYSVQMIGLQPQRVVCDG